MEAAAIKVGDKVAAEPSGHTCCPSCPGWGWFNGDEVQRCDECGRFADDEEALTHLQGCADCQRHLGTLVVAELAARFEKPAPG